MIERIADFENAYFSFAVFSTAFHYYLVKKTKNKNEGRTDMSDNIISSFVSVNMNRKLQWFTLKSLCPAHTQKSTEQMICNCNSPDLFDPVLLNPWTSLVSFPSDLVELSLVLPSCESEKQLPLPMG